LSLGGSTYAWDGANRIVRFANASGKRSTFTYDGLGRLVRIVDQTNGIVTADHAYFWCGSARCLAHDNAQSGSPISTQYFDQGVIAGGTSYYYVRDKLGSVRELITTSGGVAVQYDYDPYGNPTTLSGSASSDIGYAGYFHHAASGLDFTLYRAYDPIHARWLNRDPVGEVGGMNLYAYVAGNPLRWTDPLGLACPPGYDPTTGGLTPQAQAALDTWDAASQKVADDIAAGNYSQATFDQQTANWAAASYEYFIGQGPFAGPPPEQGPPPPLPEPQLAPAPISIPPPSLPPISID
jgi:RHS repeat-associated protein